MFGTAPRTRRRAHRARRPGTRRRHAHRIPGRQAIRVRPSEPGSVQTESLGGATAKSETSTGTKLPPGITKTSLAKGATSDDFFYLQTKKPSGSVATSDR